MQTLAVSLQDQSGFKTLGGDNCAEAQFSAAKHQVRRQNMMGRSTARKATMTLLSGQYQSHHPGLVSLLQAFSVFRGYFLDRMGIDPYDVFDEPQPWRVLDDH